MKKSEVVDIIFEFMRDPEVIHSYEMNDMEGIRLQAKICLQHLEEAGMLPPCKFEKYPSKRHKIAVEYNHAWEPEDE